MRESALTPHERMRCAVAYYCNGVQMEVIAEMMGVNNGRVAEACTAIKLAAENPKLARDILLASGKFQE